MFKINFSKKPSQDAVDIIEELIRNKQSILFLISGGSALKVLDKIDSAILHQDITVSMIDERFSTDPKVNNFLQLKQTAFFKKLLEKGGLFFDSTPALGESIASLTQRFDSFLHQWKKLHADGIVVALLGMGEDGHTAGIMPFLENQKLFGHLFLEDEWVVGYDAKDKNQYSLRVTTTMTFLKNQVDRAVVFIQGEAKKSALEKVIAKDGSLAETPARIWREMKNVVVVTDVEISGF